MSWQKVLREIDIIEDVEIEGARIKSKQEKLRYDDRTTTYFFKTDKQIKSQKEIDTLLKIGNGEEEIVTKEEILKETDNFNREYSTD